jgi:hypothetical protein
MAWGHRMAVPSRHGLAMSMTAVDAPPALVAGVNPLDTYVRAATAFSWAGLPRTLGVEGIGEVDGQWSVVYGGDLEIDRMAPGPNMRQHRAIRWCRCRPVSIFDWPRARARSGHRRPGHLRLG